MAQFKARKWCCRSTVTTPFDVVMLRSNGVYHSSDTFKTKEAAELFISELENGFLNSVDVDWIIETTNIEAWDEM